MKKRITFTWDEETIEQLKKMSDDTMIAQARLAEKAIKDMVKNHNKKKPLS